MRTVGILNEIKMQSQSIKFNLVLYFVSTCLWSLTICFNIISLFQNPIFINSIALEISIVSVIFCGYLFIKNKHRLDSLKEKELEIKAKSMSRRKKYSLKETS